MLLTPFSLQCRFEQNDRPSPQCNTNRCSNEDTGDRPASLICTAKSQKYGREFVVINRWEPTSQVCSECGYKWGKLDLKVRSVQCLNCGTEHERDENAAKNINKVGIGHCHDSKCTSRRSKTIPVVSVSEA
jgi:putative transposase